MGENQLNNGEKLDRDEKGRFTEGTVANPDGRPKGSKNKFSIAKLEEAIEAEEVLAKKEGGISVFQQFIRMAYSEPSVMIALMKKFVPDKSSQEISGIEEINFNIKHQYGDKNKQ